MKPLLLTTLIAAAALSTSGVEAYSNIYNIPKAPANYGSNNNGAVAAKRITPKISYAAPEVASSSVNSDNAEKPAYTTSIPKKSDNTRLVPKIVYVPSNKPDNTDTSAYKAENEDGEEVVVKKKVVVIRKPLPSDAECDDDEDDGDFDDDNDEEEDVRAKVVNNGTDTKNTTNTTAPASAPPAENSTLPALDQGSPASKDEAETIISTASSGSLFAEAYGNGAASSSSSPLLPMLVAAAVGIFTLL